MMKIKPIQLHFFPKKAIPINNKTILQNAIRIDYDSCS